MIELSVIIPTCNRASYLKGALASVLDQSLGHAFYEIIVINNSPMDNARDVVEKLALEYQNNIRYLTESSPGLHRGRHRGAKESRGDILVYADDDIIAFPGWLKAIQSAFSNPEVALVGGKNIPKWEGEAPGWMHLLWRRDKYGMSNGYLSLSDFGEASKEIPANLIYGCNFSIRKQVLYECGGFHPDSMPQELMRFRGDGETGLGLELMKKGYKTIYEPKAAIYHRVPAERLTIEYFCRRFFNQGISDSYSRIRMDGQLCGYEEKRIFQNFGVLKLKGFKRWYPSTRKFFKKIQQAYRDGYRYHQEQVKSDPELLKYVLKKVYY